MYYCVYTCVIEALYNNKELRLLIDAYHKSAIIPVVVESCPVVSAAEVGREVASSAVVTVVSAIDVDGTVLKISVNKK